MSGFQQPCRVPSRLIPEPTLRIAYDYIDPGSYLTWALLARTAASRAGPAAEWIPLELRTPDRPVLDPKAPEWRGMTADLAEEARALDIPFRAPSFVPHTRKAHELALHAAESECFERVHEALFEAHFVDGRDLGRVDVLVAIAADAGLDPAEVRTVLGVDRFRPRIEELRTELLDEGIRGTPTLVEGTFRLEGYRGTRELEIFLERIGRR